MKKDIKTIYGSIAVVALLLSLSGIQMSAEATSIANSGAKQAQSTGDTVRLEITTTCNPAATVIRVRNAGSSWPKASRFAIYDLADDNSELLSKRRFRLKQGQHASFRIKHKSGNARVGLWIEPGWYAREFLYDAVVSCNGEKN